MNVSRLCNGWKPVTAGLEAMRLWSQPRIRRNLASYRINGSMASQPALFNGSTSETLEIEWQSMVSEGLQDQSRLFLDCMNIFQDLQFSHGDEGWPIGVYRTSFDQEVFGSFVTIEDKH